MRTLGIPLPAWLHNRLKEMARKEGVSMNQLIPLAVSEKLSALMTSDYHQERASKGDRQAFGDILAKVLDTEPDPASSLKQLSGLWSRKEADEFERSISSS